MAQIDWSLLQTPDYFGNALKAQALGQQQRQQDAKQNALKQYSTNPQGAIDQLATVDPETAANLQKLSAAKAQATARSTVAQKLQTGDVAGARTAALSAGDTDLLNAVDKMDDQQRQQAGVTAFLLKKAPADQQDALKAKLVASVSDPTLKATLAQATLGPGVLDQIIGQGLGLKGVIEQVQKDSTPLQVDPQKTLYAPDPVFGGAQPDSAAPAMPSASPPAQTTAAGQGAAPTQTAANPDAVWAAIKQQESGGDGNAVGPQTPYGQAQGSTQMLMSTAEGQARKLGVAWRPDLMRGDTPNALAYQDKLGRAYFQEGMDKYGGDVSKATAYYFGGPNERLWGPKTQQYVQDVSARVGSGNGAPPTPQPPNDAGPNVQPAGAYQVAANGATPAPPSIPGYRLVSQGQQKVVARPATADEKAAYGIPADVPAQFDPNTGKIDVISGVAARAKPPPAAITSGYTSNKAALSQIDQAIVAIRKNPHALGLKNYLGDNVNQRLDPDGVDTRAAIANIGSKVLHDRSGAAVTAAESPRLMPFIPQATDTPEAAIKKLEGLRQQYINANSEMEVAFGADQGYAPLIGGPTQAPRAARQPAPTAASPPRSAGWTRGLPPAQLQTAMKFKGASAPGGTPENPFVPSSQAEYDKLPPGAHYVHTSGAVKVKP